MYKARGSLHFISAFFSVLSTLRHAFDFTVSHCPVPPVRLHLFVFMSVFRVPLFFFSLIFVLFCIVCLFVDNVPSFLDLDSFACWFVNVLLFVF